MYTTAQELYDGVLCNGTVNPFTVYVFPVRVEGERAEGTLSSILLRDWKEISSIILEVKSRREGYRILSL